MKLGTGYLGLVAIALAVSAEGQGYAKQPKKPKSLKSANNPWSPTHPSPPTPSSPTDPWSPTHPSPPTPTSPKDPWSPTHPSPPGSHGTCDLTGWYAGLESASIANGFGGFEDASYLSIDCFDWDPLNLIEGLFPSPRDVPPEVTLVNLIAADIELPKFGKWCLLAGSSRTDTGDDNGNNDAFDYFSYIATGTKKEWGDYFNGSPDSVGNHAQFDTVFSYSVEDPNIFDSASDDACVFMTIPHPKLLFVTPEFAVAGWTEQGSGKVYVWPAVGDGNVIYGYRYFRLGPH